MQKSIIYPGTFDPLTWGHIDIIERATKIFDFVVVAIAENENKNPYFSLADRLKMARTILSPFPQVKVLGFSSLLVDLAVKENTFLILRGLRAFSDFEYEFQLASINQAIDARIETVFLTSTQAHAAISSRMIREIAALGGDLKPFVPPEVEMAFMRKKGK